MEDRVVNSHGAEITKKPRSLDLKTLYKSSISNESSIKSVKRKGTFHGVEDVKQPKKKSRTAVPISNFKDVDHLSGENIDKVSSVGEDSHTVISSEAEFLQELSHSSSTCGASLHFDDNFTHIPRRKRRVLRRNKFESDQTTKSIQPSCNELIVSEQKPMVKNEVSGLHAPLSNTRTERVLDDSRPNEEATLECSKVEGSNDCGIAESNGELVLRTPMDDHKNREDAASDKEVANNTAEPLVHITGRVSNSLQEYDEENLEANAARMLSSRFDPSCTGFLVDSKTSMPKSALKAPFELSPGKKSTINRSCGAETMLLDDNRVLRPRAQFKQKGVSRKRRHFYELLSENLDAHWLLNRRIKVFWPLDESWYYGLVNDYDKERRLYHVKYDDRDEEWINLQNERFKILLFPSEVPGRNGRRRARTRGKPPQMVKGDAQPSKNEEREFEDDSCMGGSLESEPIISWLARLDRGKSSSRKSARKQKSSAESSVHPSLPSDATVESQRSHVEDSSASAGPMSLQGREENLSASLCPIYPKDRRVHIVYYRRRFKRKGKPSCQLTGVSGVLKLLAPLTPIRQFKIDLCFSILSVLNDTLLADNHWLFHAMYLLYHGKLVTMVPSVCLEMLFLDNNMGLRLFLFEGCLKEAIRLLLKAFVVLDLAEYHGAYKDVQLPLTSIGVRLSCLHSRRKHIDYGFYSFILIRDSKWTCLDQEVKKSCIYTRQFSVSECTYDNIKFIQNSQLLGSVCAEFSTFEGSKSGITDGRGLTIASGVSSRGSPAFGTANCGEQKDVLPSSACCFSTPPTFLLSLHLKNFMEHRSTYINPLNHLSLKNIVVLGKSDNQLNMNDISKKHLKNSYGSGTEVLEEKVTCTSVSSNRVQPARAHMCPSDDQNQIRSSEHCENDLSNSRCLSSDLELGRGDHVVSEPKSQLLLKPESENGLRMSNGSINGHGNNTSGEAFAMDMIQSEPFEENAELEWPNAHPPADVRGRVTPGTNPSDPKTTLACSRSNSSSSMQHVWSDQKNDLLHVNFRHGPKKPRTQVSYALPGTGFDSGPRNKGFQRGLPHKRIRKSNDRRLSDISSDSPGNLDLLSCVANVLVTLGDRGWREHGAQIVLELFNSNEWKLAVKVAGSMRYSYKAHQFLQPGSTNRYTHAMMWKGGKDWILEFPDRTQWFLFKEMHEECFNRNIRASSVRNIPIPGVRLIEENDDTVMDSVFVRNSPKYYQQIENDVEMALDSSHVLYDMDSEDEQWICKIHYSNLGNTSSLSMVDDGMLEKAMDLFEKAAYAQKRDQFSFSEIEDLASEVGPSKIVERIYEHWKAKRQRKGMPLIRHLQPPLWQRYQQQLKEWELTTGKTVTTSPNGNRQKAIQIEKPPMFAFCLKPRGLEVPNKGSKHRSQKKLSVYVQNNYGLGDQEGVHTFGRRLNGLSPGGDERCICPSYNYESLEDYSPMSQTSPWMFSHDPGAGYFSMGSGLYEKDYQQRLRRSKSKKLGTYGSLVGARMAPSYNARALGRWNGIDRWSTISSEWLSPRYHYNDYRKLNPEELDDAALDDFRLRDAAGAAKHARNVARLKRERAERLHYRADVAIQKAMVAIMTAEAIKASSEKVSDQ